MWLRALVLCLLGALSLAAQTPAATLTGRVEDATGAGIPGAAVKVRNVNTAAIRTAVSDESGDFTIPGLPPGGYEVEVEKTGFQNLRQTGIELQVDQTLRLNCQLQIGGVAESVDVRAEVPLLNTDNPVKGEVIVTEEIAEMPLEDRDFGDLAFLVPGVARGVVVGAEENPAFDHEGGGVGLGTQRHNPFDVAPAGRVERVRQTALGRDRVACPGTFQVGRRRGRPRGRAGPHDGQEGERASPKVTAPPVTGLIVGMHGPRVPRGAGRASRIRVAAPPVARARGAETQKAPGTGSGRFLRVTGSSRPIGWAAKGPYGLVVRTPPFHGGSPGSNPGRVANTFFARFPARLPFSRGRASRRRRQRTHQAREGT